MAKTAMQAVLAWKRASSAYRL
jgi:hypothetical protein